MSRPIGIIRRVSGYLVIADGMAGSRIGNLAEVGEPRIIGEIIRLFEGKAAIQCYEDTTGLKVGEPVYDAGRSIEIELGPGWIGTIRDGLGRSEAEMLSVAGDFVRRGLKLSILSRGRKWSFAPKVKKGEQVVEGDVLGSVPELAVEHRILVPVGVQGTVTEIYEGEFTVAEPIAHLETKEGKGIELTMMQTWPIRRARPFKEKLRPAEPLITGQRIIETFFPVAKGGAAGIPGGFGTGKTVLLQQIAKWADADIVIYIGCGERGNEMADVINNFPKLSDPKTGKKLIERTIVIANVSNMPVSAREASIYVGITLAEYFRDQGYDVALMADSTSRWAEALRDISGRLGEMPVEHGYPAYIADRTAEFYERAGRVLTLGREPRTGSVTIIGAVSPPGGDFSEPITQLTLRYIDTFWALDFELAARRHFPAINWLRSYSRQLDMLAGWWSQYEKDWLELRRKAVTLLEDASKIEEVASIIGEKALPDAQRLILLVSWMIREGFLMQHAFHEVDTYCDPAKQVKLLKIMLDLYDHASKLVAQEVPLDEIRAQPHIAKIIRLKEEEALKIDELRAQMVEELGQLAQKYGATLEARAW